MDRTPLKPVRTSVAEQREIRDKEIIENYKELMAIPGSQRTAVAKHIAENRGNISYANIMKITKDL